MAARPIQLYSPPSAATIDIIPVGGRNHGSDMMKAAVVPHILFSQANPMILIAGYCDIDEVIVEPSNKDVLVLTDLFEPFAENFHLWRMLWYTWLAPCAAKRFKERYEELKQLKLKLSKKLMDNATISAINKAVNETTRITTTAVISAINKAVNETIPLTTTVMKGRKRYQVSDTSGMSGMSSQERMKDDADEADDAANKANKKRKSCRSDGGEEEDEGAETDTDYVAVDNEWRDSSIIGNLANSGGGGDLQMSRQIFTAWWHQSLPCRELACDLYGAASTRHHCSQHYNVYRGARGHAIELRPYDLAQFIHRVLYSHVFDMKTDRMAALEIITSVSRMDTKEWVVRLHEYFLQHRLHRQDVHVLLDDAVRIIDSDDRILFTPQIIRQRLDMIFAHYTLETGYSSVSASCQWLHSEKFALCHRIMRFIKPYKSVWETKMGHPMDLSMISPREFSEGFIEAMKSHMLPSLFTYFEGGLSVADNFWSTTLLFSKDEPVPILK